MSDKGSRTRTAVWRALILLLGLTGCTGLQAQASKDSSRINLIVPVSYAGCDTCRLGARRFTTDTVSVYFHRDYYGALEAAFGAYTTSCVDIAADTLSLVGRVASELNSLAKRDTSASSNKTCFILLLETPERSSHMWNPWVKGCRVLWKRAYQVKLTRGYVTTMEPIPDSVDVSRQCSAFRF